MRVNFGNLEIEQEDLATVALGLAHLGEDRPGWVPHLREIATQLLCRELFEGLYDIGTKDATHSLLDIIIAVKEGQHVDVAELRLALIALSSIERIQRQTVGQLLASIANEESRRIEFWAAEVRKQQETLHRAKHSPPGEWLGPEHTPGTPEHDELRRSSLHILDAVERRSPPRILANFRAEEIKAIIQLIGYIETHAEPDLLPLLALAHEGLGRIPAPAPEIPPGFDVSLTQLPPGHDPTLAENRPHEPKEEPGAQPSGPPAGTA